MRAIKHFYSLDEMKIKASLRDPVTAAATEHDLPIIRVHEKSILCFPGQEVRNNMLTGPQSGD